MGGLDRGTLLALGAMALAVFVIANDITALSVALPDIENDFDSDVSTVQWVINAYALIFGVLIVTGGRLADMFGRRRLFFIGAAIFAAFSLLAGVAQDAWWLIVCRGLMGIGGAIMWPAVLGMTFDALPEDKAGLAGRPDHRRGGLRQRGRAADRRLPHRRAQLALGALPQPADRGDRLFATWRAIPEGKPAGRERIDYPGIATLSVGLIALLIALDQVTDWGWSDPRIIGPVRALRAAARERSSLIERRAGSWALIPRDVIANPGFRAACLATLMMSAVFFAALLFLPQFFQKILGDNPLEAGAGLLPMMVVFAVTSFVAGGLYDRLGAKLIVSAGAGLPDRRRVPDLADRAGLGLRRGRARHGRARCRRRPLLRVDHDGRGHRARPVALEPGGRPRLHVPGGGRGGRASASRRRSS